jgi:hypothetical protein
MFSPLLHRLQDLCVQAATPISRRCVRIAPAQLASALPTLGVVLYVPMHPHATSRWTMPHGLLVDSMQLAPLLQVHSLAVCSTIGVDGPREWFDCFGRDDRLCARLYLLPDTDYLAWDALTLGEPATRPSRHSRHPPSARAHLLRFRLARLAGLQVLGGETIRRLSPLSTQLVRHIAHVEALAWPSPTDR